MIILSDYCFETLCDVHFSLHTYIFLSLTFYGSKVLYKTFFNAFYVTSYLATSAFADLAMHVGGIGRKLKFKINLQTKEKLF